MRGGRGDAGRALAARDALVEAFYAVDRAQRDLRTRVEAVAGLDPSGDGRRLRAEFAPLDAATDILGAAYLAALDAHPLDADGAPASPGQAERDFGAVLERMRRCSQELEAFAGRAAAPLARVDVALAAVPPRVQRARAELTQAREAVARLEAEGIAPGESGALLAAAEQAAARLEVGVARLGIAGALQAADRLAGLAREARAEAERLPARRDAVRRRAASLRTRAEGLAHRFGGIGSTLSALRRSFVESSWREVEDALPGGRAKLDEALALLADAERQQRAGEWRAAQVSVHAAAEALDRADAALAAVMTRRARLEDVAADPAVPLRTARFALRDAQRLVMAGPGPTDPTWVSTLDALAGRLDRAGDLVADRPHPDWWAYLRELDAVAAVAASVVGDVRAARARQ